jgi:hypothetical protein
LIPGLITTLNYKIDYQYLRINLNRNKVWKKKTEQKLDLSVKVDTPGWNWFSYVTLFTGCHSSSLVNRFVDQKKLDFSRGLPFPQLRTPKKKMKFQIIFRGLRLVLRVPFIFSYHSLSYLQNDWKYRLEEKLFGGKFEGRK